MLHSDIRFIMLGISGKKGVGKNYVSEKFLVPFMIEKCSTLFPTKIVVPYFYSFGSCIKAELYCRNSELTIDDLMSDKKTLSIRKLLQEYGTTQGRDGYGKDIWIRQIQFWIETQLSAIKRSSISDKIIPLFVCADIRFTNELEYVSSLPNSLVIRIVSDERHIRRCQFENEKNYDNHISETELDHHPFKFYIFNDSNHDAEEQSRQIIHHFLQDQVASTSVSSSESLSESESVSSSSL